MSCSVSGNGTCIDPFCYINPVSEKLNAANFGCGEITRPLHKINVKNCVYYFIQATF